jgi:hypothetical protein
LKKLRYIFLAIKFLLQGDNLQEARRFAAKLVYGFERLSKK